MFLRTPNLAYVLPVYRLRRRLGHDVELGPLNHVVYFDSRTLGRALRAPGCGPTRWLALPPPQVATFAADARERYGGRSPVVTAKNTWARAADGLVAATRGRVSSPRTSTSSPPARSRLTRMAAHRSTVIVLLLGLVSSLGVLSCGDSKKETPVTQPPALGADPNIISDDDVSEAATGSPERTVMEWAQAVQFSDARAVAETYDPRVVERVGAARIARAARDVGSQLGRPEFVETVRETPDAGRHPRLHRLLRRRARAHGPAAGHLRPRARRRALAARRRGPAARHRRPAAEPEPGRRGARGAVRQRAGAAPAPPGARRPAPETALAALAVPLAVAAVWLGAAEGGTGAVVVLVLLQALGLAWWFRAGLRIGRGWATANFVLGTAWVALFLIPSLVYAVAPSYLESFDPMDAVAVVNVSLFALLIGYAADQWRRPVRADGPLLAVRTADVRPWRAAGWFGVGLLGLGVLMLNAGGPREYLSKLGETAGLNAGLFYVIWLVLALRFAPTAVAFVRWSRGTGAGRAALAGFAVAIVLLSLTGARAFVAIGAAQLLLSYALVKRRPSLRRVAPVAILAGLLLVFGLGTVKRHQTYNTQNPQAQLSLLEYAVDVAPSDAVDAYVNNYVDTVRLVALADAVVPDSAGYEGFRPLVQLLLKPIPSQLRPDVERDPVISQTFDPEGPFAYAEPLQVSIFLAGGPIAVGLVCFLLGFGVSRLDRWLAAPRVRSPATAAAAIAAVVQIPILIRSGIPNGAAFFGIEVLGTAAVTWHVAGGRLPRQLRGPAAAAGTFGRRTGAGGARLFAAASPWLVPCLVGVAALALGWASKGANPILGQDSAGYLADARLLAGAGLPAQEYGEYYAFGYGLLLAIPYLFTLDVDTVYGAAIGINVALLIVAALGAYRLVREWWELSRLHAAIAALAAGLLPFAVLQVGIVWPEAALTAAVTWWCVWIARLRVGYARLPAAMVALLSIACFVLHHRMAPVTAIGFLALAQPLRRRSFATAAPWLALTVIGGLAVLLLDGVFRDRIYVQSQDAASDNAVSAVLNAPLGSLPDTLSRRWARCGRSRRRRWGSGPSGRSRRSGAGGRGRA